MRNILKLVLGLYIISATVYPFLPASSLEYAASKQNSDNQSALAPIPDFSSMSDINARKKAFFAFMRSGIKIENQRILHERETLLEIRQVLHAGKLTPVQVRNAKQLSLKYNVALPKEINDTWLTEMLDKVNVIPEGLVLVQAANESAWGTSRFARKANNYFGQWCYIKGCGLIPLQREEAAKHEVAKFTHPQASIHAYFMNLNRNNAYQALRDLRSERASNGMSLLNTEAAMVLSQGLINYSERGIAYINDLQAMIRVNNKYWQEST